MKKTVNFDILKLKHFSQSKRFKGQASYNWQLTSDLCLAKDNQMEEAKGLVI